MLKKLRIKLRVFSRRFHLYIQRLLHPYYLFPVKLVTYTLYYLLRALGKFILEIARIIIDMAVFPFQSLRNFLKSILFLFLVLYIPASMLAILDYFRREYGRLDKIVCSVGAEEAVKKKLVRIVGGSSEGSGFFIKENQVLTNFHVIDGEESPKVILPNGKFIAPDRMKGDKNLDLAVLYLPSVYPDLVLPLPMQPIHMVDREPVIATGYPLGTELLGKPTSMRGRFIDFRNYRQGPAAYLQTDINVVEGMSGGPLTDQCGTVIGVNAMGIAGLSLFIDGFQAWQALPGFTDTDISKIKFDVGKSSEEAVKAYYAYIMARDLKKGFGLLSESYLKGTDYAEWTARFTDILSINVVLTELVPDVKDTVFVKFITKTWTGTEAVYKYYEGTWQTVKEKGIWKMNRSKILEVPDPGWDWFYSGPEF